MEGLIGKKIGMTQVYDADGKRTCVTVVEVGPCPVVQLKTLENDGYEAAQLAFGVQKASRVAKAQVKHFEKAGVECARVLKEFKMDEADKELKVGDKATTLSRLSPMGKIQVGEKIYEAKSLDSYVDPRVEVEVVGFENFTVIVKKCK